MLKQTLIAMASAGVLILPVSMGGTNAKINHGTAKSSLSFQVAPSMISQATASADAIQAVGGGAVTHISQDTYQKQPVYDIHVLYHQQIWDVKVLMTTGQILETKRSMEQPSSTGTIVTTTTTAQAPSTTSVTAQNASQLALQSVGGGTVQHVSSDHQDRVAVWDIHVLYQNQIWDVKVNAISGAIVQKKLSKEQPASLKSQDPSSQKSQDQSQSSLSDSKDKKDSGTPSTSIPGVIWGQKLTTVPFAYQSYVNQAITAVGGKQLKWVKFIQKNNGNIELNIKIHLNTHGTVKVKDIFSAQGQLLSQSTNS